MTNPAWAPEENRAVVALYFAMLDKAMNEQKYNKRAMIRVAQEGIGPRDIDGPFDHSTPYVGLLNLRSRGSIEAKLMNCTAAHESLDPGAETMSGHGYRPLSNMQKHLRNCVADELQHRLLQAHVWTPKAAAS